MPELRIANLTVAYGRRTVLDSVSLTARPGEILAILGENGCGKTTLLRAVQGSVSLRGGSVSLGKTDLSTLTVRRRAALVTTMTQDIPAPEGITGRERIEMGLFVKNGVFASVSREDQERIDRLAHSFGIAHLLPRPLSAMSTGERQLISLLRAAVQDTPVLLLDEPSSALDFVHTEQLYSMMTALAASGKILLLVTHDPTAALRWCHRVFLMQSGEKGSRLTELPDIRRTDPAVIETHLRAVYPTLCIHPDPLFCYSEGDPRRFL